MNQTGHAFLGRSVRTILRSHQQLWLLDVKPQNVASFRSHLYLAKCRRWCRSCKPARRLFSIGINSSPCCCNRRCRELSRCNRFLLSSSNCRGVAARSAMPSSGGLPSPLVVFGDHRHAVVACSEFPDSFVLQVVASLAVEARAVGALGAIHELRDCDHRHRCRRRGP